MATHRPRRAEHGRKHGARSELSVPDVRPEHPWQRTSTGKTAQQMTGIAERRKHARITLKGTAILLAGEHAVRARLVNLSEGGFLGGTLVTPPRRLLGRSVDIELRLDDRLAQWNRLEGEIVRIENERVAICFDATPALIRLVDGMTAA